MSIEKFSPEEAQKEGQAVQTWAEEKARKSGDKHPTSEHYEAASQSIDRIRELDPEWADNRIESATKARQWIDVIGIDLYKKLYQLFNKIWYKSMDTAYKKGKFNRNLILEDVGGKMNKRVAPLFKGKEDFLPIAKEIIRDIVDSNKDK